MKTSVGSQDELNKKLEEVSKKTIHSISETQELIQQLTAYTCQQMLEETTTKMENLCNQLSIKNEHNRNLDRKTRKAEYIYPLDIIILQNLGMVDEKNGGVTPYHETEAYAEAGRYSATVVSPGFKSSYGSFTYILQVTM
ncbi:hypothetical protein DAPPUDRAFT_267356 [Daphnia pulex]|uniref:Uncharacterized protein n=1 Tax=Daphnia pulex TaxID=6669 RepID=E9HWC8_DAPPU|nr:hypothetical protein DAPPUDRAFT_267356 [Daphnia pulex]|eukprot:EFX63952.1 hypothetical protein DAPPUDRAFT_267356 [Daphnia pulex]